MSNEERLEQIQERNEYLTAEAEQVIRRGRSLANFRLWPADEETMANEVES